MLKPADMAVTGGAVVITGASTGIGEACALQLDKMGFRVFAGVRKEADGEALKSKASQKLTPIMLEVTDQGSVTAAAETVTAALGEEGLVGLVNNAGIAVAGPLEFLPVEELRRQLEINVTGQLAVTQAFLPLIRKGHGRIINIGSISGINALPMMGAYAASKFAMEGMTDSLRLELAAWGIHVSIIEPGGIATPIWEKSLAAGNELLAKMPPQINEYYGKTIAVMTRVASRNARKGVPTSTVVDTVVHALAAKKPRTRYIVGQQAKVTGYLTCLPDRWRDRLILRQLKKMESKV